MSFLMFLYIYLYFTFTYIFHFHIVQWKVAGQSGGNGSYVQSHVAMEWESGEKHAPNPFRNVGAPVAVQRKKPPLAPLK